MARNGQRILGALGLVALLIAALTTVYFSEFGQRLATGADHRSLSAIEKSLGKLDGTGKLAERRRIEAAVARRPQTAEFRAAVARLYALFHPVCGAIRNSASLNVEEVDFLEAERAVMDRFSRLATRIERTGLRTDLHLAWEQAVLEYLGKAASVSCMRGEDVPLEELLAGIRSKLDGERAALAQIERLAQPHLAAASR